MNNTGTPKSEIRSRFSPEEEAVREFACKIVAKSEITQAEWLEGLEAFRIFLVKEIFPKITLQKPYDQDWFITAIKWDPTGYTGLFHEQMFLTVSSVKPETSIVSTVMWGLTRSGEWVVGNGIRPENSKRGALSLGEFPNSAEFVAEIGIHPAVIVNHLTEFVFQKLMERRRKLSELENRHSTAKLFSDIAMMKMEAL